MTSCSLHVGALCFAIVRAFDYLDVKGLDVVSRGTDQSFSASCFTLPIAVF